MNSRDLVTSGCVLLLSALAGCGGGQVSDSGPGDLGVDTGPMCMTGQTVCGSSCVDLQADPTHCGACETVCGRGEACTAGHCELACPTGQTACAGRCASLDTDRANCGACGVACGTGLVCSMGSCTLECGAMLATCGMGADGGAGGRYCADTRTDRLNCGSCGNACGAGMICEAGHCVVQ